MPFSIDEFFEVFTRYNEAIWPMQLFAYLAAAVAVVALPWPGRGQAGNITAILAAMWAVNGIGYHWIFFSAVNPAAGIFSALFVVQAIALAGSAYLFSGLKFVVRKNTPSIFGLLLIAFATIGYPIWGWLADHVYPSSPVFGVAPCPTTIFTIGMLLLGTWNVVRWLLIVPILWAAVGGTAAVLLDVPQDYGLFAALVIALAIGTGRQFNRFVERDLT